MKRIVIITMFICGYSPSFAQTVKPTVTVTESYTAAQSLPPDFSRNVGSGPSPSSQFKVKLYHSDEPVYFKMDQVSADIEGYDGDEIIIEAVSTVPQIPASAADLRQLAIPGRVKDDNIIKPRMQDDGENMRITIPPGNFSYLKIRVPQTALIFVETVNTLMNGKITVNNVNSIDIEGILTSAAVNNVSNFVVLIGANWLGMRATGKVTVSNIRWTNAPVIINGRPNHRSCMIRTNNSDVELIVDDQAKTNVIFSSMYSQTYSNLNTHAFSSTDTDIKEFERLFGGEAPLRPMTMVLGGGGVNTVITSTYGNIYLKKQ